MSPGTGEHGALLWQSTCGERLRASVPHGRWKSTFVAGLRRTGMITPWVLDGPMNGDAFVTCVLVPELSTGNVVISRDQRVATLLNGTLRQWLDMKTAPPPGRRRRLA